MIYGYTRISSKSQIDNNSLEQQEKEIKSKYNDVIIIREQYSGTTVNRPKLQELISKLKANDILVVTKLDRLARNVEEGIHLIKELSIVVLATLTNHCRVLIPCHHKF